MPHLILETTADLPENGNIPDILESLVSIFSGFETVNPVAVKAYHTLRSNWVMGEGAPAGFAHLSVWVLEGRPLELREKMADTLYAEMKQQFAESAAENGVSITLEVREMAAATYRK